MERCAGADIVGFERVNTIVPGIFATPLLMALPQNVLDSLAQSVPFRKRLGDPDEYAALAESVSPTPTSTANACAWMVPSDGAALTHAHRRRL